MTGGLVMTEEQKSLEYRRADVTDLFQMIKAGESYSVIGIGSVGKSNMLRFVTQRNVKRHYLGDQGDFCLTVFLNPHMIVHLQEDALERAGASWPGYELMLHSIKRDVEAMHQAYQPFPVDRDGLPTVLTAINHAYSDLTGAHLLLSQAGIRHLEAAVYELLQLGEHWKIVFIFDEMEEFINTLPAAFFQSLRGLRDNYKRRVIYITSSRRVLPGLVEDAQRHHFDPHFDTRMEGFVELFSDLPHYMRLLDEASSADTVSRYIRRYKLEDEFNNAPEMRQRLVTALFKLSGGHAGLLRRSFPFAIMRRHVLGDPEQDAFPDDALLNQFVEERSIIGECATIFESLPEREQKVLIQIVNKQGVVDNDALESLAHKELVSAKLGSTPRVRLPLLRQYVYRNNPPEAGGLSNN